MAGSNPQHLPLNGRRSAARCRGGSRRTQRADRRDHGGQQARNSTAATPCFPGHITKVGRWRSSAWSAAGCPGSRRAVGLRQVHPGPMPGRYRAARCRTLLIDGHDIVPARPCPSPLSQPGPLIFQDPAAALNPRFALEPFTEPMVVQYVSTPAEHRTAGNRLLAATAVGSTGHARRRVQRRRSDWPSARALAGASRSCNPRRSIATDVSAARLATC